MRPRHQQWKVCPRPGCPELISATEPCPKHGRPVNAHWSTDRDRSKQHAFRKATLTASNFTCQRCGHHDPTGRSLDAHHVTPTQGMTLCNGKANGCHALTDANAR